MCGSSFTAADTVWNSDCSKIKGGGRGSQGREEGEVGKNKWIDGGREGGREG